MGLLNFAITGIAEAIAKIATAVTKLAVIEHEAVEETGQILAEKMRDLAPVDEGALKGSITVINEGPESVLVGPTVDYALYVEFGSRPHWPPAANVEGWASRHGMSTYGLQSLIAKQGTHAHPID